MNNTTWPTTTTTSGSTLTFNPSGTFTISDPRTCEDHDMVIRVDDPEMTPICINCKKTHVELVAEKLRRNV